MRDFLSFMMNGVNVNSLEGLDTPLGEEDVLAILPPIGGARACDAGHISNLPRIRKAVARLQL